MFYNNSAKLMFYNFILVTCTISCVTRMQLCRWVLLVPGSSNLKNPKQEICHGVLTQKYYYKSTHIVCRKTLIISHEYINNDLNRVRLWWSFFPRYQHQLLDPLSVNHFASSRVSSLAVIFCRHLQRSTKQRQTK